MAGKASSQNAGILAGVPSSPRIRLWISQAARRLSHAVCRQALGELGCITNPAVQFAVRRARTLSHRPRRR
jgi:hypothetical protein